MRDAHIPHADDTDDIEFDKSAYENLNQKKSKDWNDRVNKKAEEIQNEL